jgi:hypothetical protein
MISIHLDDRATPALRRAGAAANTAALWNAIGRGASERIRAHLFALDGTRPNRLGGRRTHFYAAAAKSTHYTAQPGEAEVTVSKVGIRQRLEGGTIRPVRKKYLTVPAVAEAHGRRASEFQNLVLRYGAGGRPVALAEAPATQVAFERRKDGTARTVKGRGLGGRVIFWLVKSVHQKPDPTVLPAEDQIAAAAAAAADEYLQAQLDRGPN